MMRLERLIFSFSMKIKLNYFCKGIKKMRKYFLASAVALLATSNVNADTNYTNIDISANVSYATNIACSQNLSFGDIIIDSRVEDDQSFVFDPENEYIHSATEGIVSVNNAQRAICNFDLSSINGKTITLESVDGAAPISATLYVFENTEEEHWLSGTLNIPVIDNPIGRYSASITVYNTTE